MLRKDQEYDLSSSQNEAWITGRGYGSSIIIKEAIKEVTAIGGNVLLVSPIPSILLELFIDSTKRQGVFSFLKGSITYSKSFPKLDPESFDLVLVDNVFHIPFQENLGNWRKYTESSTKVIVVGSPDYHESCELPVKMIKDISDYLEAYYKVTVGSTFMNESIPESFLRATLEKALEEKDGIARFKAGVLGIC